MVTPAFQFYPKDWLSSLAIAQMTLEQEGAYIRLLSYAWLNEDCAIPNDPDALARMCRLSPEGWLKGGCNLVLTNFQPHPTKPHLLVNARLLQEREKQRIWREKSAEGGRKSAESRKTGKGGSRVVEGWLPNGSNQKATLQSSSSSSSSLNAERESAFGFPSLDQVKAFGQMRGVTQEDCEAFWHHYEGTGWIDANGNAVKRWESKLMAWRTRSQAKAHDAKRNGPDQSGPSGADKILWSKEYERLLEERRRIKDGASTDAMGTKHYTPHEKNRIQELNTSIKAYRVKLGLENP